MYSISGEYIKNVNIEKEANNKIELKKQREILNNFTDLLEITVPEIFNRIDNLGNEINNINQKIIKKENSDELNNFKDLMEITIPDIYKRINNSDQLNINSKNFTDLLEITIPELFVRLDDMSNQLNNLNNRISKLEKK